MVCRLHLWLAACACLGSVCASLAGAEAKPNGTKPIWTINIASDAKFEAASGEILTDEEKAQRRALLVQQGNKKKDERALDKTRKQEEVRPGGLIYLQVNDPDQCVSQQPDTLKVVVQARSGDEETITLTETGPYTGLFRGQVRTALKPIDCSASDSEEGLNPSIVVSQAHKASFWRAAPDRKSGKWLQLDMKNILPVRTIAFQTGDERGNGILEYDILSSIDGKIWEGVASWPPENFSLPGMMTLRIVDPHKDDQRGLTLKPGELSYGMQGWRTGVGEWPQPLRIRKPMAFYGKKDKYKALLSGKFVAPTGLYTLRVVSNCTAKVYVDNELVCQGGRNSEPGVLELESGLHEMNIVWADSRGNGAFALEMKRGEKWVDLPSDWFNPEQHPEIAGQMEAPKVEGLGERTYKDAAGNEAVGDSAWKITLAQPLKTRMLRIAIRKYSGDAPTLRHLQVWNPLNKEIVPTDIDVTKLAGNSILEMTPGDWVRCAYKDVLNNRKTGGPYVHEVEMSATYYNGEINAVHMVFEQGQKPLLYPLKRFMAGERLFVQVTEFDADLTPERDTIPVVVKSRTTNDELRLKALESEPRSGVFHVEIDTALSKKDEKTLHVVDGDEVVLAYRDTENTEPGVPFDRETVVEEARSSQAYIRVAESRVELDREGNRKGVVLMPESWDEGAAEKAKRVALEAPLRIQVRHREKALHTASEIPVWLEASSGDKVALVLQAADEEALEDGVFSGEIQLQLGNPDDPREKVIADDDEAGGYSFSMGGGEKKKGSRRSSRRGARASAQKAEDEGPETMFGVEVATVLNVAGGDTITVRYDPEREIDPKKKDEAGDAGDTFSKASIQDIARIITDGFVDITVQDYSEPVSAIQLGDKLYLRVVDPDADLTKAEDKLQVAVKTDGKDSEVVALAETLPHSGIFVGSISTFFIGEGAEKKTPTPSNDRLEVNFGHVLTARYEDASNTEAAEAKTRTAEAVVNVGADAAVRGFGKRFSSAKIAVKTQLNIAEAYFELAKQHRDLKQEKLAEEEIRMGRQILREAVKDYPDTEYAVQALYLLANLDEENKNYEDAIEQYREVLRRWPDSEYSPHANFKMALCYEKLNDFERAAEEYVAVAYRWPEHELVGSVIIRLGRYFYTLKEFKKAADVFIKLPERFPEHELAEKAYLQVCDCYAQAGEYLEAAETIESFLRKYPDSELRAEALYWGGDCYMKSKQESLKAYKMLKTCVWDYPETKWAKYARRLLLDPMFMRIEE